MALTDFTSTGYSAKYTETSGSYTISGDVTTDVNKNIVTLSGNVALTSDSSRKAAFSISFAATDSSVQDAVMAAIKAARSAVDTELDTAGT